MRQCNFAGQCNFGCVKQNHCKTLSCQCFTPDPEAPDPEVSDDAELEQLFHELASTLFRLMDPDDADILARSEQRGQTPSQIAIQLGCSQAEATRRLNHAQRCFCQLVALTLLPAKPE